MYRKSTIQLQEWYDHLAENRAASLMENPRGEARRKILNKVLKETREAMLPLVVQLSQPLAYPQGNPRNIPTGAPLTLQPEISMFAVGRRQSDFGSAPYDVRHMDVSTEGQRELPEPLNFRVICKKCGRSKAEHMNYKAFGSKCDWPLCGRCGLCVEFHDQRKVETGFYCTLTESHGASSNVIAMYDSKIESLAFSRRKQS